MGSDCRQNSLSQTPWLNHSWHVALYMTARGLKFEEPSEEWGYKPELESFAHKCLDQVKSVALEKGVTCNVMYVEHDHPYQAIIEAAANEHCDLIVMASHGRGGLSAIVLGSQTVKVLTHSAIPVLVCR
jgi:nucleotide-binding universal stress UspA family protein